jgi:hypothetical protein
MDTYSYVVLLAITSPVWILALVLTVRILRFFLVIYNRIIVYYLLKTSSDDEIVQSLRRARKINPDNYYYLWKTIIKRHPRALLAIENAYPPLPDPVIPQQHRQTVCRNHDNWAWLMLGLGFLISYDKHR